MYYAMACVGGHEHAPDSCLFTGRCITISLCHQSVHKEEEQSALYHLQKTTVLENGVQYSLHSPHDLRIYSDHKDVHVAHDAF